MPSRWPGWTPPCVRDLVPVVSSFVFVFPERSWIKEEAAGGRLGTLAPGAAPRGEKNVAVSSAHPVFSAVC